MYVYILLFNSTGGPENVEKLLFCVTYNFTHLQYKIYY